MTRKVLKIYFAHFLFLLVWLATAHFCSEDIFNWPNLFGVITCFLGVCYSIKASARTADLCYEKAISQLHIIPLILLLPFQFIFVLITGFLLILFLPFVFNP